MTCSYPSQDIEDAKNGGATVLDLSGKGIDCFPSSAFSGLTSVQHLKLQDNPLVALENNIFSEMTSIQSINVSNTLIPLECPRSFLGRTGLPLGGTTLIGFDEGLFFQNGEGRCIQMFDNHCQGDEAVLRCEPDEILYVWTAIYGRSDSTSNVLDINDCTLFSPLNSQCTSETSTQIVQDHCNIDFVNCTFPISNQFLGGDPCACGFPNPVSNCVSKYLDILFTCSKSTAPPAGSQTTSSPSTSPESSSPTNSPSVAPSTSISPELTFQPTSSSSLKLPTFQCFNIFVILLLLYILTASRGKK